MAKKKSKKKSSESTSKKVDNETGFGTSNAVSAWIKEAASNRSYRGKIQIKMASEYSTPFHLRRPTGVLGVDLAIGGGFPAGGSSQIYGAKSAGKTYLAFRTAAQVQKNYGENACIAVAVTEHKLDVGLARMAGFWVPYSLSQIAEFSEIRDKQGRPQFTSEELIDLRSGTGEIILIEGSNAGELFEGILGTMNRLESALQLVIIDSLGTLLTPEAEEKETGAKLYGGSSSVLTSFMNKLQPMYIMDRPNGMLETTVVAINQVRALIGATRPGMTRPAAGSKAWEHAQLVNLELRQGEPIWEDRSHKRQAGREVKWEIKKGKAGCHEGIKGTYDWLHPPDRPPVFIKDVVEQSTQYGIDTIRDLVDTARTLGVIETAGAWLTLRSETGKELHKCQGVDSFVKLVVEDPELEAQLYHRCLRKANLTIRYR